jgi:hypothetical protein
LLIRLSEGLATLHGFDVANLVYPDDALMDFHFVEVRQQALEFDAKANTRPLTRKVNNRNELNERPDKITGKKG